MNFLNIFKALRILQYVPEILMFIAKFKSTVQVADGLLARVDIAAAGGDDFVLKSGSDEAKSVSELLRRVHDVVTKLDGAL